MSKLEAAYQRDLIKRIKATLPGAIVLKTDPTYLQGIPDLLVLYHDKYALLEVKKSATASHRPNQGYYVDLFNDWSYSAFVYPENEEDILDELQSALRISR